jgi:hypothetical protein
LPLHLLLPLPKGKVTNLLPVRLLSLRFPSKNRMSAFDVAVACPFGCHPRRGSAVAFALALAATEGQSDKSIACAVAFLRFPSKNRMSSPKIA